MIQTYFGNGKGKTSCATGCAIRCAGCGHKVLFVQFLKNNNSAEFNVLKTIKGIDLLYSDVHFKLYDNLNKEFDGKYSDAYNQLLQVDVYKLADRYKMIVLDEVLDAVEFGYIEEDVLLNFVNDFKARCEILLTGHKLCEKIAQASDYISEVKEVRHPYKEGVLPREGIEF